MKAHGIIKGKNIILKQLPSDKKLADRARVEVIILPLKRKPPRFSTFKLGVKKEHLNRERIYAKN
jgi:hypothetical protein